MSKLRALYGPLRFMGFILGVASFIGGMVGFFLLPFAGYYSYALGAFLVWFFGAWVIVRHIEGT